MCVLLERVLNCFSCFSYSAGIGRTGAFCALSSAIERVKAEGLVDVFHIVKHLRTQRPHMVQTVVSVVYTHTHTHTHTHTKLIMVSVFFYRNNTCSVTEPSVSMSLHLNSIPTSYEFD